MKIALTMLSLIYALLLQAQININSVELANDHPRYLTLSDGKNDVLKLIENEEWANEVYGKLKLRTDKYIAYTDEQPDWLLSRLAMYWNSHATDVYIRGEAFSHTGGERSPVPTVRYTGTRGTVATHGRPKLEDVIPYDDDNDNVTFCNNATPERVMEKVHPSKTGRNIEGINREIIGIARDAAFLYWLTDEEKYARLASGVFDTYMQGIYYRNVPIDLNYGHQQTLVGMSSFEVIHENILYDLVPLYDFLYNYLVVNHKDKMDVYADAFKKWADNIIDNGVPHNNWNLMQARYITDIGMILEDNEKYKDGKGRKYYLDYVLNQSSIRQWSLNKLAEYGFDLNTGIWAECPGYSSVVLSDYTAFATLFDRNLNYDLIEAMPIISKAVTSTSQYLFPNKMICGFGDTHPTYLKSGFITRMIQNAQTNNKVEQERFFTSFLKCVLPEYNNTQEKKQSPRVAVSTFFDEKPLKLDPKIEAGNIEDFVSPLFYAPNVSWLVQRNGMNPRHSLMISLNGSDGNHMHANGISMELYGKGYVLGPDAGIGKSSYSGLDYLEYYSQFPSHNTVCVDGISSYPIMKSNHAFKLLSSFPISADPGLPFTPITFSELAFKEPETQARQTRMMSIVTTGNTTGYYVDIFRSKKEQGGDKMHDYFYHNLGQTMTLTATDNSDLRLEATEKLSFAGAHLYAYSYLYDKKVSNTDKDVKTTFTINMTDGDDISMTMWMKGEKDREVYTALAPFTEGLSRTPNMPYNLKEQPTLTYVARQYGEAWSKPFVSIYEPSSTKEPGNILSVTFPEIKSNSNSTVGICVNQKDGRSDLIISSDNHNELSQYDDLSTKATYTLLGRINNEDNILFLGYGTYLRKGNITIKTNTPGSILIEKKDNKWYYYSTVDCNVKIKNKTYQLSATNQLLPIIK